MGNNLSEISLSGGANKGRQNAGADQPLDAPEQVYSLISTESLEESSDARDRGPLNAVGDHQNSIFSNSGVVDAFKRL